LGFSYYLYYGPYIKITHILINKTETTGAECPTCGKKYVGFDDKDCRFCSQCGCATRKLFAINPVRKCKTDFYESTGERLINRTLEDNCESKYEYLFLNIGIDNVVCIDQRVSEFENEEVDPLQEDNLGKFINSPWVASIIQQIIILKDAREIENYEVKQGIVIYTY